MSSHVASIDIEQPVRVVYDQWTQLESFPGFMDNVGSITPISDGNAHWTTIIAGELQGLHRGSRRNYCFLARAYRQLEPFGNSSGVTTAETKPRSATP
jgi:hypothetical protein